MKITDLQRYMAACLERFGDIECMMDVDAESDDIFEIDGVFCDISDDDPKDVSLVFACYEVRAALQLVK